MEEGLVQVGVVFSPLSLDSCQNHWEILYRSKRWNGTLWDYLGEFHK